MNDGERNPRAGGRVRLAVTVLVAAVALASAATTLYPRDPVDLGDVAEAMRRVRTARVELHLTTESKRRLVTVEAHGEVDFRTSHSRLRVIQRDAGWSNEEEVVHVGGTSFYRRSGATRWTSARTGAAERPLGVAPDRFLAFLDSSGEVTALGAETVDGVPVTRYRAVVDLEELNDGHPPPRVRVDPVDVWVDGAGLARKIAFASYQDSPGGASTMTWRATVRFYDFRVPVDVEPPPSEDVVRTEGSRPHWGGRNTR